MAYRNCLSGTRLVLVDTKFMGIDHPYCRIWRPHKNYNWIDVITAEDKANALTIDYLGDNRFANQADIRSLIISAHLIITDLYTLFNYVEPCDDNISTYSHRIYELFLRAATEFETNCKGILKANDYSVGERNMNISNDYFKISSAIKLSEYRVIFHRWATTHEFKPFGEWNTSTYSSLGWYKDYTNVKHNRLEYFNKANLGNLMNSIAALLCILHAQVGSLMHSACYEGLSSIGENQKELITGTFTLIVPNYSDDEQYDFVWNHIKNEDNPIQKYSF